LVQPSGDGAAAAVVALDGNGAALGDPTVIEGAQPSVVVLPSGAARALVALTWAPADYDPNSHDFAARPVAVSLAALPDDGGTMADLFAPSLDASIADSSPSIDLADDLATDLASAPAPHINEGGCGCAVGSAGSGGAIALALLMLLGWMFRRNRRSPDPFQTPTL
jgi:MYXO-CTERM domain-containing protein